MGFHLSWQLIGTQDDVGGWPARKGVSAPKDADHNGMPDSWEDENKS